MRSTTALRKFAVDSAAVDTNYEEFFDRFQKKGLVGMQGFAGQWPEIPRCHSKDRTLSEIVPTAIAMMACDRLGFGEIKSVELG